MRIVYLWDADYPWDVRTEKVCAALTGAGHEVHVVARNRARLPLEEALPEGTVHRMPPLRWLPRRVDEALSFPAFCNPRWIGHLRRAVRRVRPQLVVVRDLPLAPAAIGVARRHGIPVVMDMAENYPAMTRQAWDAGRQRPWDHLLRNPRLVAAVERWCLPRLDRVVVVVPESGARLRALGVPAERVAVVSNTPPRDRARGAVRRPPSAEAPTGKGARPLRVVYLGLMEVHRGVGELLDAAALLRERGVAVHLRLVGDGRDLPLFRRRAAALGLGDAEVEFCGRLPHADALAAVAAADVGTVPHHADEAWNTTIPNKLFDYMAAGLPVVSSDAAPPARVLAETGAGLVFRAGDAASLADALAALVDPARRHALGEAGRRAVLACYHWEADVATLLRVVREVAGPGARTGEVARTVRRGALAAPG